MTTGGGRIFDEPEGYAFGPFSLYAAERRLERGGVVIALGDRAFDLLIALLREAGQVVEKGELLRRVWPNVRVEEGALRVSVAALRAALGEGEYLTNVRGRGYQFVAPVRPLTRPEASVVPDSASLARLHGLPARAEPIYGRDQAIDEVSASLAARRFVTIVGAGGMGKTTLAMAVARRAFERDALSVCFVDLSALHDADMIPNLIANRLGLQLQGDPALVLVSYFRDQRMLLILDSCEHVIDGVAVLAEQIVRDAPRMRVLATSREPLRAEGERIYRLEPLLAPAEGEPLSADEAVSFPSVRLLVERAAAARHDFTLSDGDADLAAEICRRLDGIALAIELAAASIGAIGLKETASRLNGELSLRWAGRRTAVPRHQTLRATLDWSYSLLDEAEQVLLRRLSILVGAFSLEAAVAVCADATLDELQVLGGVSSLVAKSLVSTEAADDGPRYRLLDITRAYVRAKLVETGELDPIARRHAAFLVERLAGKIQGGEPYVDDEALAVVARAIPNVRAAIPWCFGPGGDVELGWALTVAAAPALLELGLWPECAQWTGQGIETLGSQPPASLQTLELLTSHAQAQLLLDRQDAGVKATLELAAGMAAVLDQPCYSIRALLGLHRYLSRNEDYEGSLGAARRMAEIATSSGNEGMCILAQLAEGISHHFMGDQARACALMGAGLGQVRMTWGINSILFGHHSDFHGMVCLARALWLAGRPDEAIAMARRSVEFAESKRHAGTLGLSAIWVIQVFFWTQDWDSAQAMAGSLLDLTANHPSAALRKLGLALKGELLTRSGDLAEGLPLLKNYLEVVHAAGRYSLMPTIAYVEGLIAKGDLPQALAAIDAASSVARSRHHLLYMPEMIRLRGEILKLSDPAAAARCFDEALALAEVQSALSWSLRAAMSQARLQADAGNLRGALEGVQSVYGRFTQGFDTSDLIAARAMVAQLGQAVTVHNTQ
ncbi:MAG: winged helix-turn-helix domain-containing protein [Caulobacteraceae bacterium]|nr:winged helix-turn-helix domain-containing protein [Caulobacteraceae bacterium]